MNIAVLGAGNVGGTLGKGWAKKGHTVRYGVPDPKKYPDIDAGLVSDVVPAADVVVLATPWTATKSAVESAGNLAGKVLIDATNAITPDFSGVIPGPSAAEQVAGWAVGARVVKAFNTVGFNIMENSTFPDGLVTMLLAGDDAGAKEIAEILAKDLGFDPIDAGPLSQAHYIEAQAWIWISLAMKYGQGRDIAFRLMKR